MLEIVPTTRFRRDLKRCTKRGKNIDKIEHIVSELQKLNSLSSTNKDHSLVGRWVGFRECHIEPDWLLIYRIEVLKRAELPAFLCSWKKEHMSLSKTSFFRDSYFSCFWYFYPSDTWL